MMAVCNNKYSESSPIMLGVKIRLCVIVWKMTVEYAIATPVIAIAITLMPRRGNA